MKFLISLLNHVPTSIAARFRPDGLLGRSLRRLLARANSGEHVVAVVRAGHGRGIRLPLDPGREKYYWAGQHDVPVQDALVRVLTPGATVWDVGAHIGFFTILASRIVTPAGHVHSFEPMPDNRRRLKETVLLNGASNVTVHDAAVSGEEGSAVLHEHEASAMWTLVAERGESQGITVVCRTIDSLAAELGDPAVLKIDVEGAEVDVLRGGLATLRRARPTLIVEFAVPAFVEQARPLLPWYRFEQVSDLDWLLVPSDGADVPGG